MRTNLDRVSSLPTLNIAIIGMGGIGSAFAFQLARFGHHNITAVARPGSPRLRQLQRDAGIVNMKGECAETQIADTLDEHFPYDLVLLTLPAYQVEPILAVLQRSIAKRVQFMFNVFDPERLRDAIGAARCSFGMPLIQASLDADGRLNAKIGANGQKSKMNDRTTVQLFESAGLPAVYESDMLLWLRCQVPLCIAFESVSVAAQRRGGGASWSEALIIAQGLQEGFRLIRGLGYPIYPSGKARLQSAPAWVPAAMLWFMSRISSFRELLATGRNEGRALVDVLVEASLQAKPSVSVQKIEAMKPK